MTGNSLELYAPNKHRNIVCGQINYLGTVKDIKIGQSAAKLRVGEGSETIPQGSTEANAFGNGENLF